MCTVLLTLHCTVVGKTAALSLTLMNWGRLNYYQAHLCTAYLPTRSDLVLLFVNYLLLFFSLWLLLGNSLDKFKTYWCHCSLHFWYFFSAHLWYTIFIFWALLVSLEKFQILCWFVLDCDQVVSLVNLEKFPHRLTARIKLLFCATTWSAASLVVRILPKI